MRQHSACHRTVETQSVSPSLFPQVLIRENNKSLRFQMKRFRPIAETLRVGFVGGGGSFSLLCTRVHPRHSAACGNVSPFCEAVLLGFAHHHLFSFVPLGKDGGGGGGGGGQSLEEFGACVISRTFLPEIDNYWHTETHTGRREWGWPRDRWAWSRRLTLVSTE